ncbi:hypothetical protein BS47DRAFT_1339991 [Hydnum rufescens UP504]|uniref:Uncharacterized protein n=1 Tax=Hydnum rufescens UP504 TaxID=1448309 RepID=A0A9P6DZP7_9AGAM|nr:hypothetical protein BS47DRAFT_1339991 [Hydnum rufescens UP504]
MPTGKWASSPSTLAGAGAGLVSSIVTCPLDVIKTKVQAAKGGVDYVGVLGTTKQILIHDGVKGLYRGLGPTITGYLPTWAIYFSLYDGIKTRLGGAHWSRRVSYGDEDIESHSVRESMSVHVSAAMAAGATSTIISNPLWVIKTRFMTQPLDERRYRHTLDAFVTVYRREGIGAFYRGLVPSLLGVSHVAVQFPLYEELKVFFADRQHIPVPDLDSGTILLCSAVSKMTASLVTYPHEVIRTRLQVDYAPGRLGTNNSLPTPVRSPPPINRVLPSHTHPLSLMAIMHTIRAVVRESGWRGMYRGLSVNLLRTVPNSGITLLTYELIMRQLSKTNHS